MVALNQQFAVLATFCSLAAISLFPLSVNAVAIQGRAPSSPFSPPAPFYAVKHGNSYENRNSKREQHKGRALDWSPISNVIRMADMAISSARHSYSEATAKRNNYETQAHFHPRDISRHEKHRSSVVIPSNQGGSYILSPGRRSSHAGQSETIKRGDKSGGVPGRVDLKSPTNDSSNGKKLGSLVMQESKDHIWFLNASENNYTRAFLVNAPPGISGFSMPSGEDSDVPVNLQFSLFDSPQPNTVPYCATTNGKAASAEPQRMTVEKCFDKAQEKSDEQKSQTFAYNGKTGTIRPIWVLGQDDNKSDDPTSPNKAGTAGVTNVMGGRDEVGEPLSAKNVTLVFVPDTPEVANAEEDTVTATSTMTTTITITSMSTAMPSVSAADVEPTSIVEASLTFSSTPSSSATASSNTESSMPVSTPMASAAALNVQVIGANNTSSSDPAVTSATLTSDSTVPTPSMTAQDVEPSNAAASATITSDSTTPTTSVNAEDVAASIAASGVSSSGVPTSTDINDPSSIAVPTAAAVESPLASDTSSSPAPTMTPVSTSPSQMMFKADSRL